MEKLSVVTYQPEIALNLGNIARTCACLDMQLHVVEPCGFPFSVKALKRSGMDYTDLVELHHHMSWDEYIAKNQGNRILLTTKSSHAYTDYAFAPGDHLIFGQESAGVPETVAAACQVHLTIPMPGGGRSLNLASAVAMVAGEAARQIRAGGTI